MKKLLIVLLTSIFIAGCTSNDAEEAINENNDSQSVEDLEKENEQADDEDKSKLTEDEAKEKLIDYMKENEEEYIDGYDMLMEEEDNSFQVNIYPSIPNDEERGPSRVASYEIDQKTGAIERVDDWDTDETEPHISELVDFSEEERRAHHEKLAGGPEHIQEKVYEHLMLPGVHENTEKYEGRINPGERIRFRFPDAEKFVDRSTDDPELSEDGYFTINLAAYEFKAGEDILVSITKGYPQEQTFNLIVNEAQEGMEEIRVRE